MIVAVTVEDEISSIADRLVHLHGAIDLVLPRVGQIYTANGIRTELLVIADEMLQLHTRLHAVLEQITARQES
jgi:hypothetical protein